MIARVIQRPDVLVLWFRYRDVQGNETSRVVSPYRLLNSLRFSALCLIREEPRQFDLRRCEDLRIGLAADVLMPSQNSEQERYQSPSRG
jgi:predicted DNA-binding transcriptional regulator YafY